jgi:hypothetical protein
MAGDRCLSLWFSIIPQVSENEIISFLTSTTFMLEAVELRVENAPHSTPSSPSMNIEKGSELYVTLFVELTKVMP